MWVLAFSIYSGLKWLTFAEYAATNSVSFWRSVGYLLFWAGMDAPAFFSTANRVASPKRSELVVGFANFCFGLLLIFTAIKTVDPIPVLAGWMGMAGIVFVIHFGVVRLLSILWRRAGVNAQPIMNAPILATSLSDFWSKRWNLAFRDVAYAHVFRPLVSQTGVAGATLAVFLVSGVIHDAVISIPSGAGYGFPTLYFVIQGVAVLFEKKMKLGKGMIGRVFCFIVILGPISLLFHPPFINIVIIPMFKSMKEIVCLV